MLLMTLDVNSLYTCMPHSKGIEASRQFLKKRDISYFMHTEMILTMMHTCISNNYFMFDDADYCQAQRTVMGTFFAPSFAGLYLGLWEEQVASNILAFNTHVVLWARYIDDIFCLWRGMEQEAVAFVDELNDNQYNLKFTSTMHKEALEFLDVNVTVNRKEKKLESSLFRKSTAGNSLLYATSCHPKNLIHSIPYGELLRARRN